MLRESNFQITKSCRSSSGLYYPLIQKLTSENLRLRQKLVLKTQILIQTIQITNWRLKEISKNQNLCFFQFSARLKTPLTAIKKELLISLKKKNGFKRISQEVQNLTALLESTHLLFQIDLCLPKIKKQSLNLTGLVNEICLKLQKLAQKRKVTLKNCTSKAIFLQGHPQYLKKALFEIIYNAVLYNRKNGLVEIYLDKNSHFIKAVILDTGIGMNQEEVRNSFQYFYRTQIAQQKNHRKSGLGLPLARKIIEKHQGIIQIKSEKGQGTAVVIKFKKGA